MIGFGRIKCFRLSKSEDEFVEAEDLEALQALFTKYCDKEGLMTKEKVTTIPPIEELLVSECEMKIVASACAQELPRDWKYQKLLLIQTLKASCWNAIADMRNSVRVLTCYCYTLFVLGPKGSIASRIG